MDKRKIVHTAREKINSGKIEAANNDSQPAAGGQKSLLGDVLGAVIGMVGQAAGGGIPTAANLQSQPQASTQSEGRSGKASGHKPQTASRTEGRVASIGRNVADQLKGNK